MMIKIPVTYEVTAYVEFDAKSYEEAFNRLQKLIDTKFDRVLNNVKQVEYMEGTMMIDCELDGLKSFNECDIE